MSIITTEIRNPSNFALSLAEKAEGEMARVYADVNQQMPRSYWDYDSVNITWGILENYEVVRKIGKAMPSFLTSHNEKSRH